MDQLTFERAGYLLGLMLLDIPCGDVTMRYEKDRESFFYAWSAERLYISEVPVSCLEAAEDLHELADEVLNAWKSL